MSRWKATEGSGEDASQGGRRRRHRRRNRPPGAPPILHQICRKLNASGPTFVCNANLDLSTSVECLAYLVANVVEGRA